MDAEVRTQRAAFSGRGNNMIALGDMGATAMTFKVGDIVKLKSGGPPMA